MPDLPKENEKDIVKCRQWDDLCNCIRAEYPGLKVKLTVKGKERMYAIHRKSLKLFLQEKGFICKSAKGKECRPTLDMLDGWIYAEDRVRLTPERQVHEVKWRLVVTEYGYARIIDLLQGKNVKLPEHICKGESNLSVDEIKKMQDMLHPKKPDSVLEIMRKREGSRREGNIRNKIRTEINDIGGKPPSEDKAPF